MGRHSSSVPETRPRGLPVPLLPVHVTAELDVLDQALDLGVVGTPPARRGDSRRGRDVRRRRRAVWVRRGGLIAAAVTAVSWGAWALSADRVAVVAGSSMVRPAVGAAPSTESPGGQQPTLARTTRTTGAGADRRASRSGRSSTTRGTTRWTTSPGTTSPGATSPGTTSPGTTSPGTTSPGTTSPGTTSPALPSDPATGRATGGSWPTGDPTGAAPADPTGAPPADPTGTPTGTPTTDPPADPSTGPSTDPGTGPAPAGWRLVWADEFSGSGVDAGRWKVEDHSTYGDGNGELACLMNRPENVQVSAGVLHLIARHEGTPVACGSGDSRFPGGRPYTSAHLSTKGKADWTYGRFEVRAKLPTQAGTSKGLWPAFWLRPTAGGTGELDVLEAVGGDGAGEADKVHQTIWYDYSGTHPKQVEVVRVPGASPSSDYHVYAAEWEPGVVRWYVDGRLTYTRTRATTPWLDEAFGKPFYLRLNLAVGGSWPGAPSGATSFPASYDVDYVRVYQR